MGVNRNLQHHSLSASHTTEIQTAQETFRIYAVCYLQLSLALGSVALWLKSYTICCLEISNGFVILSVDLQIQGIKIYHNFYFTVVKKKEK